MPGVPIVLAGMKDDQIRNWKAQNSICSDESIDKIRALIKPVSYFTCSTVQNKGLTELFENVARIGFEYKLEMERKRIGCLERIKLMMWKNPIQIIEDMIKESEDFGIQFNACTSDNEALECLKSWKSQLSTAVLEEKYDQERLQEYFEDIKGKMSMSEHKVIFLFSHSDGISSFLKVMGFKGNINKDWGYCSTICAKLENGSVKDI